MRFDILRLSSGLKLNPIGLELSPFLSTSAHKQVVAVDQTGKLDGDFQAESRRGGGSQPPPPPPEPTVIRGTPYDDTLNGTAGDDIIYGEEGRDTIYGNDGNDTIYAGDGDPYLGRAQYIYDGAGNDTVYGGVHTETFMASPGNDYYDGGGYSFVPDSANYFSAISGVLVDMRLSSDQVRSLGANDAAQVGVDTLVRITTVSGSNYDDQFFANDTTGSTFYGNGGNDRMLGGSTDDQLDGGDGDDYMDGAGGWDYVSYASAAGSVTVSLAINSAQVTGQGTDTILNAEGLVGSRQDDILSGNEVNNRIDGGGGSDYLYGGGGNDWLEGEESSVYEGGDGNDTLASNGSTATFIFRAGDDQDRILGLDSGRIDIYGYESAQSIVQSGGNVVVTLSSTDIITVYSSDVAAVTAALHFYPAGGNGSTLVGTPGDDVLSGNVGDDSISGYGGNDTLNGGGGSDTIDGGTGDDILYSDMAYEHADAGSEHDVVKGGAGNDALYIGYGDDADGGDGADILRVNLAGARQGVTLDTSNIIAGTASIGGGAIRSIERVGSILGSDFDDHLTIGTQATWINVEGAGGNDSITVNGNVNTTVNGGEGDDRINVLEGIASVYGGEGADIITVSGGAVSASGGTGDDIFSSDGDGYQFLGDDGNDTVRYIQSGIAISIDLGVVVQLNGDTLIDIENASGSNYGDTLYGNDDANRLEGLDGDDTLAGRRGNDVLVGGTGNDTFVYGIGDGSDIITDFAAGDIVKINGYTSALTISQEGSDVLVVFASGEQILFQYTTVPTVQAGLQFSGEPPKTLTGTAGNDVLTGGSGDDKLSGLGGNDTLDGKAGKDAMSGGTGNDTYYVDNVGDTVTEGASSGTDTVHSTISYTLGTNVENGILDGAAAINLTGNALANTLTGNDGANTLSGLAGADRLIGGGGNDRLDGGVGIDTLTGGTGRDTFVFSGKPGNDKITDFVSGQDFIDLSAYHINMSAVKASYRNGTTTLSVDTNHDGRVDFTITLTGSAPPASSDFIF